MYEYDTTLYNDKVLLLILNCPNSLNIVTMSNPIGLISCTSK